MPQRHQVRRLEELALEVVGDWVKTVGRGLPEQVHFVMQSDPKEGQLLLQQSLADVRETLYSSVPWYFYEKMSIKVLTAVMELVDETKSMYTEDMSLHLFITKMKVHTKMTEIVIHPLLKKMSISEWPIIIRRPLYTNLSNLVGLEELDLECGYTVRFLADTEMYILPAIQSMPNLRTFSYCFDCTNSIIRTIGRNCPLLQEIDITSSRSVDDQYLWDLWNCKALREVEFQGTSVSAVGYKRLLTGLSKIQSIGSCNKFGKVLEMLHEEEAKPLPILSLECNCMTTEQLKLLVKYCPGVNKISLSGFDQFVDLTILSVLSLHDLEIANVDFNIVRGLLEQGGSELLSLHLECFYELNLNDIIHISQCCPKLKSLTFFNCELLQPDFLNFDLKKLDVAPFACLERLVCVSGCDLNHLEVLLKHCKQIKIIELGSYTGINNTFFSYILQHNPMALLEELKIQNSNDLTTETLDLLMMNCDQLRSLTDLECWQGLSAQELQEFRDYIQQNNFNLNTTLTFC